jgi:hypothetical protein
VNGVTVVLSAIDFNGEPKWRAIEVDKISSKRMLTTKTLANHLSSLQEVPEFSFGVCSIAPQATR